MGAAEVPSPVRIHVGHTVVDKIWVMEVLMVAMEWEGCTPQAMVVITCLEAVMLGAALTHQCTQIVAWAAVATWAVVVQDHTIDI
uniref:Uncharacterized protein n=1 Tax=Rhizophora mucronata TaxID=61149 RepID=A0A2P2KFW9_RHIMU